MRLTLGKAITNTAIRWVPFFLPTLALAFNASTSTLAAVLGLAEAAGLSTFFVGRWLDAGRERLVIMCALAAVSASSALALIGSVWSFAGAAILLGGAAANVTAGGHAWISTRAAFHRRARFIGIYEISWALALLIGAPVVALLINGFGWRAPFIAVGLGAIIAAVLIGTIDDGKKAVQSGERPAVRVPVGADAWIIIGAAAATAMAGLSTIVIAGTWLDQVFDVSTGGVGFVAMAFGAAELTASVSSASFADRLGKRITTQAALTTVLIGLLVIYVAGTSIAVAAAGLLIFFVGFEYAVVTSFSLVSEALPAARGRAIGIGQAASTIARGVGVTSAGFLFDSFGIGGPVTLSIAAAAAGLALLTIAARRRPDLA